MTTTALALPTEVPISLDKETKKNLVNWEDFVSYYLQLSEAANSFSWIKADVLLALAEKFGDQSLEKISSDIGEPASTVVGYVRVARAFPADKRDPMVTFSHHYQASFADSYNEKGGDFSGEERFKWIEKVAETNMSTRSLREEISEAKEEKQLGHPIEDLCALCHKNGVDVEKYVFFKPGTGKPGDKFKFHALCYMKIIKFIADYGEKPKA